MIVPRPREPWIPADTAGIRTELRSLTAPASIRHTRAAYATALLLACTLLHAAVTARCAEGVALVEAGQAKACIVIGSKATEVERFAAEELQDYVRQMTLASGASDGAQLPILTADASRPPVACEILIGRPETNPAVAEMHREKRLRIDTPALGPDGYVIKTVTTIGGATTLLLTGSHDRSSLFAVYHFLEICGVRFFGYRGRNGELVPRGASLQAPPLDLIEKPTFRYRFVSDNNYNAADKTKLVNVADWAAKNRCNAFMLTPSRPGETWQAIALDEVRKRGLMIAGPGHVLAQLTPDKALFATHPEYFPLLKDQRNPVYSEKWGGAAAFCWSNNHAMRIVVSNAVNYLAQAPLLDIFAVYPPDGSQHGVQCQCSGCAKLSMSDWYLTLINNIASAAAVARPRQKFMWIAYNECGVPPSRVRPWQNGKNFVLLWCNDIREFHAPMDSAPNRHAARYLDWKPRLKTIKTDGAPNPGDRELAAWHRWRRWSEFLKSSHYSGEVVLLDYYNQHVGQSLRVPMLSYCQSGPWPDGGMQKDFQFYAAQGIAGWQNCTDYYNDNPNPYWNRLSAQLLWNPHADLDAMNQDFYRRFYGPAGDSMREYFAALWRELAVETVTTADAQRVQRLENLLSAADAATPRAGSPELRARLKAAQEFHRHCAKSKIDLMRQYYPDGTPIANEESVR